MRSWIALCLLPLTVLAAEGELPAEVQQAMKAAKLPADGLAVYVMPVQGGAPLYQYREQVAVNPASTMKLVTTFAGLELLGPTYSWRTELYGQGRQEGERWVGDLYLKGYGDPKLTQESLWLLVRQLRLRGIREISGELRLDRRYFPQQQEDDGQFDGAADRPYNVVPDPLLVNFKTLRVRLYGSADGVRLLPEPALPRLQLVNKLRVGGGDCTTWRNKLKVDSKTAANGETQMTFSGEFPASCQDATYSVALGNHADFIAASVRDTWREIGGRWSKLDAQLSLGSVPDGAVPAEATLLASQGSPVLREVIHDINKFSNNLMARQLFLTLGVESGQAGDPLQAARERIQQWLRSKSLQFGELVMENGSGLSRIERISTQHMAQLLRAVWQSPYMPELISSLPIAGVDGTIRKRFAEDSVATSAHMKTGTLQDVRALSGFVRARSGQWWIVVAVSHHKLSERAAPVLDALVSEVYENH
ncbi:D-alanyl-D-alanine carboxypeptidase/D-alanyl-D-alanine endopeptidase [Leeia aquatica]|uniref:D-alanyl-D-alanine carboxypeptidase/D-alanyl-D-alanine-endopeptidase n=1 Tax=Leeia aquatica TaxID=2725557 RepID=A0A847SGF9_9NEIS|nr:D-alanyl-D-alanine carboxypeptidase/D-alanyl-D-alanine-endopeptidase [Leeia aquatica]NLR76299.1 D-alanyl-D-alanine carboxypeptidase/D-alanyl-D-alanine-endopeptidase [Leeia aquatica]